MLPRTSPVLNKLSQGARQTHEMSRIFTQKNKETKASRRRSLRPLILSHILLPLCSPMRHDLFGGRIYIYVRGYVVYQSPEPQAPPATPTANHQHQPYCPPRTSTTHPRFLPAPSVSVSVPLLHNNVLYIDDHTQASRVDDRRQAEKDRQAPLQLHRAAGVYVCARHQHQSESLSKLLPAVAGRWQVHLLHRFV